MTHKIRKKTKKVDEPDLLDELIADEPKAVRKGWPSKVPILVVDDIAWNYSAQDGSNDLQVWLELTFDPKQKFKPPKAYRKAHRTLCAVISERFKAYTRINAFLEFVWRKRYPSKEWQAACWNEMLHRLEYTVPKSARADPGYTKED